MNALGAGIRCTAVLLSVVLSLPCVHGAEPQERPSQAADSVSSRSWVVALPAAGQVVLRGDANFDSSGIAGGSQILYPAAGLGGFIAAVLTHGVIAEASRKSQKDKLQEDADKTVLPYRSVLEGFDSRELMQRSVTKSQALSAARSAPPVQPSVDWVVQASPVFVITADEAAVVLYNTVAVRSSGAANAPVIYQKTIRVISRPRSKDAPDDFWIAAQGEKLKEETALLVAESLDIAIGDIERVQSVPGTQEKTFRYREGNVEKIERAQLVAERCDRVLIRTLRGDLLSFPSAGAEACAQAARGALTR